MPLSVRSASEYPIDTLITVFNDAFKNYVAGDISLDRQSFQQFCTSQTINLALSQIAIKDNKAVALALLARRGWTSRLAAMGVIAEARYQGVGKEVLAQLVEQARQRQDKSYELEVIEQNPAALKLYSNAGFKKIQRLVEGSLQGVKETQLTQLKEIDIAKASNYIISQSPENLPWQLSGYNLAYLGEPNKAFKLKDAVVIISDPKAKTIRLLNLTVAKNKQRQKQGTSLLNALMANYPEKTWRYSALCPEETASFFYKHGFHKGDLSQFQMKLGIQ